MMRLSPFTIRNSSLFGSLFQRKSSLLWFTGKSASWARKTEIFRVRRPFLYPENHELPCFFPCYQGNAHEETGSHDDACATTLRNFITNFPGVSLFSALRFCKPVADGDLATSRSARCVWRPYPRHDDSLAGSCLGKGCKIPDPRPLYAMPAGMQRGSASESCSGCSAAPALRA
jgi:hypothetical protein